MDLKKKRLNNGVHSETLLEQLNKFRQQDQFTDVVLLCQNERIVAHRNVLAASSPYFEAMLCGLFPERTQREIELCEMDAQCLKLAVDFIYGVQVKITAECAEQLLVTAAFLQLDAIADLCAEFLVKRLSADNCVGFKHFAEKQNNFLLLNASKDYLITHFKDVMKCQEFLDMFHTELDAILSDNVLFMHSDDEVLKGLVRWTAHNPQQRIGYLGTLLRYIHPACVSSKLAHSLPLLAQDDSSCQWLDDVQRCVGTATWRVFLMDKMGHRPDLQRFDLDFELVTQLKPVPQAAFAISLTAYKNILYAQGGSRGRSTGNCYYFNVYRDQWYTLTPMLMERSHHRSLVANDCLYALGGNTRQGATCAVECLNLVTHKSMLCEHMLAERSSMGAAVYENSLYVMGGETDHRSLFSVEHYDPREGHWNELPSMKEVNSYCSSAVVDSYIYCCEGLGSCMERFDVRANKWEILNFWEEREFYEIFAVENSLFSISGKDISRYDVSTCKWLGVYAFPESREWDTAVGMQMVNCSF